MFKKISMAIAVILVASLAACQKVDKPETPDSVALATQSDPTARPVEGGSQGVTIYATSDWTATSNASWITVYPESGTRGINEVVLTYTPNSDENSRQGEVVFASKANTATYVLTQAGTKTGK